MLIPLSVNKAKAKLKARDSARKVVRKAKTEWVCEWLLQRQHHGWYEKLMKHLEESHKQVRFYVLFFVNFLT